MQYPPYRDLERLGVKHWLESKYEHMIIATTAKSGYDITVQVHLDQIRPEDTATSNIIHQLAALKQNVLGAPLERCFNAMRTSTSTELSPIMIIPYRPHENMYVQPQADRIVIVYSVGCFADATDQAIARVFLQEYAEAGRRVNNAPPMSFSRDPPLELRHVLDSSNHPAAGCWVEDDQGQQQQQRQQQQAPPPPVVGFLSLAVFPTHVATDEKMARAITMIQGFRNYLHYHIKTTKSYLHSRMRTRVDLLMHVLNRAHPDKDPSKVSKKTISGKTFTRAF